MKQEPVLRTMRHDDAPEPKKAGSGLVSRMLAAMLRRYAVRNERMAVCETLSLGGRRSVALIECDGRRFLAGLSASGVETLVPVDTAGPQGDLR